MIFFDDFFCLFQMAVDSICYFPLSLLYHDLFYFVIGQRAGGRNEMNDDTNEGG